MTTKTLAAFVVALGMLWGSAAARDRQFAVVPSGGQKIEFVDGQGFALLDGVSASVAVTFYPADKHRGWIAVMLRNVSNEPFNVDESLLRAATQGQGLTVYSYERLLKEQKRRAARQTR